VSVAISAALLGTAALGVTAAFVGSDARGVAATGAPGWLRRHGRTVATALVAAQLLLAIGSPSPGTALAVLVGAWTVAGWAFTHVAGRWPAATWRAGGWGGLALIAASALAAFAARGVP
jgi:hypothetical protein